MKLTDLIDLETFTDDEITNEAVVRQMRRYGNTTKLQYRCQDGDKEGRLVSKPSGCGIRKNPNRVRAGKRSSRIRKGERVRKSNMTKRKTLTKNLVRRNKILKGPTANTVLNKGVTDTPQSTSNITSTGTEGTTSTS